MAQKKRQTAKGFAIKHGRLAKWLGRDSKALIFVLLFGVVGVALLIRSFAQSDYPTDGSSIVAAYVQEAPTVASQENGVVTYQSSAATYLVLGDGSLQCDNGNTAGDVAVGKLSQNDLKKLHNDLVNLGLNSVPHETGATASARVNNSEDFVLASGGSTSGYAVNKGAAKPDKLAKMQAKVLAACAKATAAAKRGKTNHVKPPKLSDAMPASLFEHISQVLSPSVEALPAANGSTIDKATADDQYNSINYTRASKGLKLLSRQGCLDNIAYAQAQAMANSGSIYHDPTLGDDVTRNCGSWTYAGENVGSGSSSSQIFQAFVASSQHLANILNTRYKYVGTGAYKAPGGRIYVAQEFGTW